MTPRARALVELGRMLADTGYEFTTVTPQTHAIVNARAANAEARDLRDVFGWSRPFEAAVVPSPMLEKLRAADVLRDAGGGRLASTVRWSTLGHDLLVHSAFPTEARDAVFFGPDTYRFCTAIERFLPRDQRTLVVDVGCGCGAGGIVAARRSRATILADVTDASLELATVNATLANVRNAEVCRSNLLSGIDVTPDAVVANPPFMLDDSDRKYRSGGGTAGEGFAVRLVRDAMSRLAPGGTLLVYTGAPFVSGKDLFFEAVEPLLARAEAFRYEVIDVDIFGEALRDDAYAEVERIAAVVLVVTTGDDAERKSLLRSA